MTSYRLRRTGESELLETVVFAIAEPADRYEAILRLRLSRAAWQAQDSPQELHLTMTTAPTEEEPVSDRPRYFVTLSATCSADQLQTVVDHLSGMLPGVAAALPGVEGLSLSFTREDADEFTMTTALPVAPDPAAGVPIPPPGTDDQGMHAAPEVPAESFVDAPGVQP